MDSLPPSSRHSKLGFYQYSQKSATRGDEKDKKSLFSAPRNRLQFADIALSSMKCFEKWNRSPLSFKFPITGADIGIIPKRLFQKSYSKRFLGECIAAIAVFQLTTASPKSEA